MPFKHTINTLRKQVKNEYTYLGYNLVRISLLTPLRTIYDIKVYGRENMPKQSSIYVCNHSSFIDPFAIVAGMNLSTPIHFLTRDFTNEKDSSTNKAVNYFFKAVGQVIVKLRKDKVTLSTIRQAKEVLETKASRNSKNKKGRDLWIFGEGERNWNGEIGKFHDGASFIASITKKPIVPVYLHGTYNIWPRTQTFPKLGGKIEIRIGTPLIYQHNLTEIIEKEVRKLSDFSL